MFKKGELVFYEKDYGVKRYCIVIFVIGDKLWGIFGDSIPYVESEFRTCPHANGWIEINRVKTIKSKYKRNLPSWF